MIQFSSDFRAEVLWGVIKSIQKVKNHEFQPLKKGHKNYQTSGPTNHIHICLILEATYAGLLFNYILIGAFFAHISFPRTIFNRIYFITKVATAYLLLRYGQTRMMSAQYFPCGIIIKTGIEEQKSFLELVSGLILN